MVSDEQLVAKHTHSRRIVQRGVSSQTAITIAIEILHLSEQTWVTSHNASNGIDFADQRVAAVSNVHHGVECEVLRDVERRI